MSTGDDDNYIQTYCSILLQDVETGAGEFGKELSRAPVQVEED